MTDNIPSIGLKPKADPRPIRWGASWVYDNRLVIDRGTKALAPDSVTVSLICTGLTGPDDPVHPQPGESGYLKSLCFAL